MLYFEDLDAGAVAESGSRTVTKEGIIEFAEQWDPQPFHVDEEAAGESMFGGLVASGLHTLSLCNVLATDAVFGDLAVLGGRGIDGVRFHEPVRPGDTLRVHVEVASTSEVSRPGAGHAEIEVTGHNQADEQVITWRSLVLVERRDNGAGPHDGR
jgi:acyl dehydratase